ncbi:MAG: hypothetical protein IJ231_07570 [Clostridia bacterium]|nr:hypothetical protein [Clostridia bacterium]
MKRRNLMCAALAAIWLISASLGCVGGAEQVGEATAVPAAEAEAETERSAGGEAPAAGLDAFEEKGLTLGESSVQYPALREGAAEELLRERINTRILEDGKITDYVTRVSQLISGGSLRVAWQGSVLGPVFSFAVSAEGAVATPRPTFVWTAGNIDLRDGGEITWEELFAEPEAAREAMEAYLEEAVAPELSAHLLNSQLTPVPELFRMTERGLILLYDIDQLSTLSDRAGEVLIPWPVIRAELNPAAEGIPAAMGLLAEPGPEDVAAGLRAMTAAGAVPGIPLTLGDRVKEKTDRWHLLMDPDVYAAGRLFSLEGASFWQVFLMTDFLSESWENSVVDGIRVDLGCVGGLTIGETTRETWLQALGEPEHTIAFDGEKAEAYRTVPGSRDYYVFGDHRLQLHADEAGVLASVILSE